MSSGAFQAGAANLRLLNQLECLVANWMVHPSSSRAPCRSLSTWLARADGAIQTFSNVYYHALNRAFSVDYMRTFSRQVWTSRVNWNPYASLPSSLIRKYSLKMARNRLNEPILLVCDLQEKFEKAIYRFDHVVHITQKLLKASDILGFPVAASTQNKDKLGDTVAALQLHSRANVKDVRDKTLFSMYAEGDPQFLALLRASDDKPRDILLVGIETHICVTQTTLDLLEAGHRVYVISDAVSSCNKEEKPVALARLARAGAFVTTSESILYEIMGDANIPEFRDVAKLVKESKTDTTEALRDLHW